MWPWPCSLIMSSRHSPTTTKNNEHFSSITCFLYTNTWERPEYCKYHEVFVVYFKSQHKQDSLIPFFWIFLISWKPDKLWSFLNVMDWSCCLESSLKQSTWARLVSQDQLQAVWKSHSLGEDFVGSISSPAWLTSLLASPHQQMARKL